VQSLEFDLFSRFFTEHARWLIKRHLEQPLEQDDLPEIETFYDITDNDQRGLPPYLQNLHPGWHEIISGSVGLHVYIEDIGDHRYIVVHDQSEFEQREVIIGAVLFVGIIGSLAFAWWVSSSISGRIIKPLSKLSDAIEQQQPINTGEFANDEVGNLASVFVSYRNTLEDFLKRERFFTSDVSHELRTPLMSASAAIELLLTDEPDGRRRATLQRAGSALTDMRNLVETFLALSRQPQRSCNIGSVWAAQTITEEIRRISESVSMDLQSRIRCDVRQDFRIECAPTLLSVVLGNLLRNAVYYCSEGNIDVIVAAPEIIIADSGSGIAPALIDAVFHGDGRAMPSIEASISKVEGHGLGLFIVKRICDHCNWPISVISGSNGTTFTLRCTTPLVNNPQGMA
jgi:signal transduction histidine kinase